MVSLFALGIPGGGGTAVLLAAFTMHNITGGPRFLRDHGDVVYAVILANFVQGALLLLVGLFILQLLAAIVKVPLRYLIPMVFVMAARSEEHTSELQSLMRISYAVFCLKKKKTT